MKKYITPNLLFLSVVSLFTLFTSSSFAENRVTVDGLEFNIEKVTYGKWSINHQTVPDGVVERVDGKDAALSYIAIAYTLINKNDTKKVDLDGKFDYKLFDDFGNRYRPIKKPEDYNDSVLIVSKSFPSLFPGEKYGETLFFEAPVSTAKTIKLIINLERSILSKPVELVYSSSDFMGTSSQISESINNTPRVQSPKPAPALPTKSTSDGYRTQQPDSQEMITEGPKIRIISPLPGVILNQGESAHIIVGSEKDQIPKKIIVIAFDNTFEDPSPKKDGIYDINVPSDQAPGAYVVNVIAEWSKGEISSALLDFYVKDANPLGVL